LIGRGAGALWMSLHAEGGCTGEAGAAQLEAELGGRRKTEHLRPSFPREKKDEERRSLARDTEKFGPWRVLGIRARTRIDVYR